MTNAKEWYIENVKEECDSADEFFYDEHVRWDPRLKCVSLIVALQIASSVISKGTTIVLQLQRNARHRANRCRSFRGDSDSRIV